MFHVKHYLCSIIKTEKTIQYIYQTHKKNNNKAMCIKYNITHTTIKYTKQIKDVTGYIINIFNN